MYTRVVVETEASATTTTLTLTPNVSKYTLSASISRLKTVVSTPVGGQVTTPLRRRTIDQILTYRSAAVGPNASNGTVWAYCLIGLNELELYPTPQAADVLTFYYTAFPTPLSANGDVPILPEPYATDCLVFGGSAKMAQFSGDPDMSWYQQLYDDSIARLRTHLNRLSGRITGQFNVQDDMIWPPHDPSTDIR